MKDMASLSQPQQSSEGADNTQNNLRQEENEVEEENQEDQESTVVFKFEPFVLAVECRSLDEATTFLSLAICSAFRESGLSSVEKRKIVSVRSSNRLEAPLVDRHLQLLVSKEYLLYLFQISNLKFKSNLKRIQRFQEAFVQKFCSPLVSEPSGDELSWGIVCHKVLGEHIRSFLRDKQLLSATFTNLLNVQHGKTPADQKTDFLALPITQLGYVALTSNEELKQALDVHIKTFEVVPKKKKNKIESENENKEELATTTPQFSRESSFQQFSFPVAKSKTKQQNGRS
eukprot:TRINITY_DN263_c0_g1_i2.p1 TRINITY_DN263_c0_g1~~TRINITY_DN263_c0_g1_i2.p1  ORF type:complete len:287 (-),score=59.18 TRINITY_DN263_c0_g1_i2:118-978(-)